MFTAPIHPILSNPSTFGTAIRHLLHGSWERRRRGVSHMRPQRNHGPCDGTTSCHYLPLAYQHILTSWVGGKTLNQSMSYTISWDIAWDIDYIWLLSMTVVLFTSIVNIWGQTCWDFGWLWATRRWRGHHKCIEILKTPARAQPRDAPWHRWNMLKHINHLAFVTMFAFTGVLTERYLSGAGCATVSDHQMDLQRRAKKGSWRSGVPRSCWNTISTSQESR